MHNEEYKWKNNTNQPDKPKMNMQEVELKPGKIVMNGEPSLEEWCTILNCEKNDLLKAISIIGNSVKAVDDYLILNRWKKC